MSTQERTWGGMIWGATKVVAGLTAAALVLPVALTNVGSLITSIGGETAGAIGGGLSSAGGTLGGLNASVAATVFPQSVMQGLNLSTASGLGTLASSAGSGLLEAGSNAASYLGKNAGAAAAIGAGGLAVGYMIRGAEAGGRRAQATGGFAAAEQARRQLAALSANTSRA